MLKRILCAITVMAAAGMIYAGVTLKSEADRKQYTFALEPGDRVIVLKKTTTLTIKPATANQFDLIIPAGKKFNGMLILN